jgi:hypothetical protein
VRRLLRPGPLHRCVALQAGHQLLINLFEPLPEPLNFLFGLVILPAQRGKGRIPLNDITYFLVKRSGLGRACIPAMQARGHFELAVLCGAT